MDTDDEDDFQFRAPPKGTAPLRLQSPLQWGPIEAALSCNPRHLGSQMQLWPVCEAFYTGASQLAARGMNIIKDPSELIGLMLLVLSTSIWSVPQGNIAEFHSDLALAFELMKRQEKVILCGLASSLPTKRLKENPIPELCYRLHHARKMIQDWLITYIDHTDGKACYTSLYGRNEASGTITWEVTPRISLKLISGRAGALQVDDKICFLPPNTARSLHEIIAARSLVFTSIFVAGLAQEVNYPDLVQLEELLREGDTILYEQGNQGYSSLKKLEGAILGNIIAQDEKTALFDKTAYLRECCGSKPYPISTAFGRFCVKIEEFITTTSNRHIGMQVFGLFRIWGYPHVNTLAGLDRVRTIAREIKTIDPATALVIRFRTMETIYRSYFTKHGHYPPHLAPVSVPLTAANEPSEILSALHQGRHIITNSPHYKISDWQYVTPLKTFEPEEFLGSLDLLSDKACSAGRQETARCLGLTPPRLPAAKERRTLIRFLEEENVDVGAHLNKVDKDGFSKDDLIIGLTPKERELKETPRMFSLMTVPVRLYFTATEHLLAECLVPLIPGVAMGLSSLEVKKILDVQSSGQQASRSDRACVALNIDFERWNLNERKDALQPLFSLFDQLFGYSNVFQRTHEVFEQSVFYLADGFILPSSEDILQGRDSLVTWGGHYGGMEGLRQKGWTIGTVALIDQLNVEMNLNAKLMGQGDNQIITINVPLKKYGEVTETDEAVISQSRSLLRKFVNRLEEVFGRVGLPLKPSESWMSTCLFAYGKETLWMGSKLSMSLKRVARMMFVSNEQHATFYHTVSSVFANSEAVVENDATPRVGLTMALYELLVAIRLYWYWTPIAGESLGQSQLRGAGWTDSAHEPYPNRDVRIGQLLCSRVPELLEVIALSSHDFGGYPTQNMYSLAIHGFTDMPSLHYGFAERYLALNEGAIPIGVANAIRSHYNPVIRSTPNKKLTLENPSAINIVSPRSFVMITTRASKLLMESPFVKNTPIRELVSISKTSQEKLADLLILTQPLMPRVLSVIWDTLPTSMAEKSLSKFENSVSLKKLAGKANVDEAIRIEALIGTADSEKFSHFLWTLCDTASPSLQRDVYSAMTRFRQRSFGTELIAGLTCPPPISYIDAHLNTGDGCLGCSREQPFTSVCTYTTYRHQVATGQSRGPASGYLGSRTAQKVSSYTPYRAVTKSSALINCRQLVALIGWLFEHRSLLGTVIEEIVKSLTSCPMHYFIQETTQIDSSATHRIQDERNHHHGSPGTLHTTYTLSDVSTNTMGQFGSGAQDHPINFQHLICLGHFMGWHESFQDQTTVNIHLHVHDMTFLPELNDTSISLPESALSAFESTFPLPSFPSNKFVFARKEDVQMRFRPGCASTATSILDPLSLDTASQRTLFDAICAQELIRSFEYSVSAIKLGRPPSEGLPYLYYSRCNPVVTLMYFVRSLPAIALSMAWSMHLERRNNPTLEEIGWSEALRVITNVSKVGLRGVAGMFTNQTSRQRLLPHLAPSCAPKDFPISLDAACEAARRTIISLIVTLRVQGSEAINIPFRLSLLDDQWHIGLFIRNACGAYAGSYDKVQFQVRRLSAKKQLSYLSRLVGYCYNYISAGALERVPSSVLISLAGQFFARCDPEDLNRLDTVGLTQACISAFGPRKLRMSGGNVKRLAAYEGRPNRIPRSQARLPIQTSMISPLALSTSEPEGVWIDSLTNGPTALPYLMTLRQIKVPNVAWYKYVEMIMNINVEVEVAACVGDGGGGIGAVVAALFEEVVIRFNSLNKPEGGNAATHTESGPTALETGLLRPEQVRGVASVLGGVTDLSDGRWPQYFVRLCGQESVQLLTCDANYGSAETGTGILANLIRYLHLTESTGATMIVKSYFVDLNRFNQNLLGVQECFRKVRVMRSQFSGPGASECFIFAEGYRGELFNQNARWRQGLAYLGSDVATRLLNDRPDVTRRMLIASEEHGRWASQTWGQMLMVSERIQMLAQIGIVEDLMTWEDVCRHINLESGMGLQLDHLMTMDTSETGREASYRILSQLAAAMIVGLVCKGGQGINAVKYLACNPQDWMILVGTIDSDRRYWRIWVSPSSKDRSRLYQKIIEQENAFGQIRVSMLALSSRFWTGREAELVYRLFGLFMITDVNPTDTCLVGCTSSRRYRGSLYRSYYLGDQYHHISDWTISY